MLTLVFLELLPGECLGGTSLETNLLEATLLHCALWWFVGVICGYFW